MDVKVQVIDLTTGRVIDEVAGKVEKFSAATDDAGTYAVSQMVSTGRNIVVPEGAGILITMDAAAPVEAHSAPRCAVLGADEELKKPTPRAKAK